MNCGIFRDMIGSYLDETLDEEQRQWFRGHLRECKACREVALLEDPSLLFAAAESPPAATDEIEACVAAVTAGTHRDRLDRRLKSRRRPWLAAAAAAVVIAGGGLTWRAFDGVESGHPQATAENSAADGTPKHTPPSVEVEMASEDVRVYQLATDGDEDTAVYFIVDPSLEL